ncbi:hypothetical protein EUX98_g7835 [Antrodiella citrinella]|uniref:Uncharacterized protein n=1 Tax=Antrodiella citrinella TaxID=2447956 RepID=A0A4S4MKK2_9APHY|nr:hypothetical protein EUX98_g7835 [Antrodiella citrinella]
MRRDSASWLLRMSNMNITSSSILIDDGYYRKVRLNLVDLTSILSAVADVLEHLRLDTVAISREDSEESTAEPDNEPGIAAIVPPPRIHLSRLKTCRFSRCDAATLVLNAVRFPITTQVELVLDSSSSDATTKITPDTQELLRSCFQHTALGWNQRGIRSTSTISELDGSDKGLSIEGATINTPHVGIILCRSLVDWSSIVFLEFGGNLKKIVQSYPPRGPPQQCRMDYADYPFETWYSVFDSLPALTTLVVYDDQVTGIQNMMEVLYAPEPRCCPNLRSLTMVGWDFDFKVTVKDIQTIRETGGPNDIRGSSIAIFLYYINMVIQSRKDTGIPLDELRFKRCRLHKATTNLFKALFADLKVIAEV